MRNDNQRNIRRNAKRHIAALLAGLIAFAGLSVPVSAEDEQRLLICGKEEHAHTDACYARELVCQLPEEAPRIVTWREYTASFAPHEHSDACLDADGQIICGYAAGEYIHSHNKWCYDDQGKAVCGLQETGSGHRHTDDCFVERGVLVCGRQEDPGHTHTDACYTDIMDHVCGLEEGPGHTHGPECYAESRRLICGLEENDSHTHGEACYEKTEELICGLEEKPAHIHTKDCYGLARHLTCDQEERPGHTHTAGCYALRKELNCEHENDAANAPEAAAHRHSEECFTLISVNGEQRKAATCGFTETPVFVSTEDCWTTYEAAIGGHTHTDACYAVSDLPVCGLEEHTHTEECYAPASDPADAEEASQPAGEPTGEPADSGEADAEEAPGEEAAPEEEQPEEAAPEEEQPEETASEEEQPEEAASEEEQPEEAQPGEIAYTDGFLAVEGPDYTVTAAYGPEARLPADTQLLVREIEPGTEEYARYCGQANDTFRENWRTVEYARFFDISFVSGGQPVQPAAPADVRIILNRVPSEGDESLQTVHFDSDGIKIAADADNL